MTTCGIYCIENIKTGEVYIGQSVNIERRWEQHKQNIKTGKYSLYHSMRIHGLDSFRFTVIERCSSADLNARESAWIDLFLSTGKRLYNIMGVPEKEKYVKKRPNKRVNKK